MKLIFRIQKENPITREKITVWCCFSLPPVFLQGDLQCNLQFQSTRAKNRFPALAGCSTSHHTTIRVLGDCGEAPHDQQAALRGRHSCRKEISCLWNSGARMILQAPLCFSAAPVRTGTWGASRTRVLGSCVCLHFPPAMPALGLVLLPREQIVGCIQCSWPLPDVNPRVLAIDG